MLTNLLDATRDYWRKLDEVEAAYNRDEITLDEVDTRVHTLIAELGQERRKAFRDTWGILQAFIRQQGDTLVGVAAIGLLATIWLTVTGGA